jgi:hypothetical protein
MTGFHELQELRSGFHPKHLLLIMRVTQAQRLEYVFLRSVNDTFKSSYNASNRSCLSPQKQRKAGAHSRLKEHIDYDMVYTRRASQEVLGFPR